MEMKHYVNLCMVAALPMCMYIIRKLILASMACGLPLRMTLAVI